MAQPWRRISSRIGPQLGLVDDGPFRVAGDGGPREVGLELRLGQTGQQHPALRGRVRRQARPDGHRDGHQPAGLDAGDVQDLRVVEDRDRCRLTGPLRQRRQVGLRERPRVADGRERLGEVEDGRRQREGPLRRLDVAEVLEGQQDAARGGPGQAGPLGDLADRQARGVGAERAQDRQPALE